MSYKAYLIDLDGTAYLGDSEIPTAKDFVNKLVVDKIPFLFLSNNSSKSNEQIAQKLIKHGYNITPQNIYTSAQATARYLEEKYPNENYYLIGDDGLRKSLSTTSLVESINSCKLVIVGYDNKLDYEKLKTANILLSNGAKLISTNPDIVLPTENGPYPGNGAAVKYLETSSSTTAITIGKPSNIIMDYAISELNIDKTNIAMIGDNYDTDIMSGINANIDTIYVQTGLTTIDEINKKDIKPTIILKDLSELKL